MPGHSTPPVIGIIGGSGVYDIDGLSGTRWQRVESPFGAPSDELMFGTLDGQKASPTDAKRMLEAFIAALHTRGFTTCSTSELESGLEKIALYSIGNIPTHVARQLSNGWWTSKLGPNFDIEHANLETLAGGIYGFPVAFLGRAVAP